MHHDDGPYLPARLALLLAARHYVTNLTSRPVTLHRVRAIVWEPSRPDYRSGQASSRLLKKSTKV